MTYPCVDTRSTYIFMSHEDDFRPSEVGPKKEQASIFSGTERTVLKHQASK